MQQLDLFERTLLEEFEAWLATPEGGQVADEFTQTALSLSRSKQREGARAIWEHLRWSCRRRHAGGYGEYRFNDHHVPYLARRAMKLHPELTGFFELRDRQPRPGRRALVIPLQSRAEKSQAV